MTTPWEPPSPTTWRLAGKLEQSVLDRGRDGRYVLIVLADTPEILAATVAGLISGEYRGGLLSDFVGVHEFAGVVE